SPLFLLPPSLLTMKLLDYPAAIAEQQRKVLQADQRIRRLQDVVNHLTAEIDTAIAFDASLKNDAQRKAKRLELMSAVEYRTAVANLQIAQDQRAELDIDLALLRNQLSVLKLEKREAITMRELQLTDAA
ncbi:MAG TPA: hypothetical protein V6C65_20905, partial [Allocoleopsis sp.]